MASKSAGKMRSRNLKERVSLRNAYRIQEETKTEFNSMRKHLAKQGNFKIISQHLASHLIFRQVPQDHTDPFEKLSKSKGQMNSKKLELFFEA
jgi:hypothetical protein